MVESIRAQVVRVGVALMALCVVWLDPSWAWAEADSGFVARCTEGLEARALGAWSLLPPAVAVLAAFLWRRIVAALLLGVLVGALLAWGPWPHLVVGCGVHRFLVGPLTDTFHLQIIGFTLAIVGLIQVMTRSGAVHAVLHHLLRWASTARRTRLTAALMGLVFFFDDYANTVLVGSTMRPATDRQKISREKLAWLVDSTSAPVAGLALLSTWIAFEVGILQDLSQTLELGQDGYTLFLMALPFRFYCFAALMAVFVSSASGRDWGPMWKAERRAAEEGLVTAPGSQPLTQDGFGGEGGVAAGRVWHALVPFAVLLVMLGVGILRSGSEAVDAAIEAGAIQGMPWELEVWRLALGEANIAYVLLISALAAGLVAIAAPALSGVLSVRDGMRAWWRAIPLMRVAVAVLVLAWAIKEVCTALETSAFLVSMLSGQVALFLFPLLVFFLSGLVAFGTGTSWGAMAIVLPIAVPVAYALAGPEVGLIWVVLTSAAVLDGAIFGDHCSPISDTTVLSSTASGCDHMDHVRTQVPYALSAMLIAATGGYLLAAMGAPPWMSWCILLGLTLALFYGLGRRVPEPRPVEPSSRPAGL